MRRSCARLRACAIGLAVLAGTGAVDAPAADPPGSVPVLSLVNKIKNQDKGGPTRLRRNTGVHVQGPRLYVSSYYGGAVNLFRRDPATGALSYDGMLPFEQEGEGSSLAFHGGRMYAALSVGHADSDADSRGLAWFRLPDAGPPEQTGSIPCPVGDLLVSPTAPVLWQVAAHQSALLSYRLDPATGAPSPVGRVEKQRGLGKVRDWAASPDGQHLYLLSGVEQAIAIVATAPDGGLSYRGFQPIEPLGPPGYFKHASLAISPDGRFLYASRWEYDHQRPLAIWTRDPTSGRLAFEGLNPTVPEMERFGSLVFEPDGRTAYFISYYESPGDGIGWLLRDPASGRMDFGGLLPESRRLAAWDLDLDPATRTLYAGTWLDDSVLAIRVAAAADDGVRRSGLGAKAAVQPAGPR